VTYYRLVVRSRMGLFRNVLATNDTENVSSIKVGSPMNVESIEVTIGHSVAVLGQATCSEVKRQYSCNW
jgi:hypothetical protein